MRRHSIPLLRPLCLAAGLALAAPSHALIYVVGAGSVPTQCDFNSLQAAINAAASNPGPDIIRVAVDQTYTAQALTIGTQDLTIIGGYTNCAAALPPNAQATAPSTVLSGAGGSQAPVISITGSGVRQLFNLDIANGDASRIDGNGGGINFRGAGDLVLRNVIVRNSVAAFGGGIRFRGDSDSEEARLSLSADVGISFNTAQISGGGLRVEGNARVFMNSARGFINGNEALGVNLTTGQPQGGFGGGIQLLAPADGEFSSPGFPNIGAVFANRAVRGGGVAVIADDGDADTFSKFFRALPDQPFVIRENTASVAGGGVYLQAEPPGISPFFGVAVGCFVGAHIDANRAPDGAAIYADSDSGVFGETEGGRVWLGRWTNGGSCARPANAVDCAQPFGCTRISDNFNATPAGVAQNGATIALRDDALLDVRDTVIGYNTAQHAIRADSAELVDVRNSLIIGNTLRDGVMRLDLNTGGTDDRFLLIDTTIADNPISVGTHVVQAVNGHRVFWNRNIINQIGKLPYAYPGGAAGNGNVSIEQSLFNDSTGINMGPSTRNRLDIARFVDPTINDYRLRWYSQAINIAANVPATDLDLGGRPRGDLLWGPPGSPVPRDAGAWERQSSDALVVNGGFYSLAQWAYGVPMFPTGLTLNTDNDGSDGTGSAQFSVPSADVTGLLGPRVNVLSQCFLTSVGGAFTLTARALAAVNQFGVLNADQPILRWRYRENDDDCLGPATVEADVFFNGGAGWQSLVEPAVINVPQPAFGQVASIEIRLDVRETRPAVIVNNDTFARFDNVVLTRAGADPLFSNGFETP
jgi:hypothetical protein